MGQNPNYMKGRSISLGQMREGACKDVDQRYGLDPGTCWERQKSGDFCSQIANTAAYLTIRHAFFPNETKSIRDALRGYGGNAPYDRYADPILDCEKCMNEYARTDAEGKVTDPHAQVCFDKLTEQANAAAGK